MSYPCEEFVLTNSSSIENMRGIVLSFCVKVIGGVISRLWRELLHRAGIENTCLHNLWCSYWRLSGTNLHIIGKSLEHKLQYRYMPA